MYLNCHTYYSFRYGTFSVEELVAEAADKGVSTLALTDINNTSATLEFISIAKKAGIKPVAGIEFRRENLLLYIGIARNNHGFGELCRLLTSVNRSEIALADVAPELSGTEFIYPLKAKSLHELKPNEWLGITLRQLESTPPADIKAMEHKLVVLQPVVFKDKKGHATHRLLRAVSNNTLLSMLPAEELASETDYLIPPDELLQRFGRHMRIIKNTLDLLERCEIGFENEPNKNRKTFTGSFAGDVELLQKLAFDGMRSRYGKYNRGVEERVRHELKVIAEMNFCAYFLINWDITRYAQMRNFRYVGRGSGANSLVAYCLKITDVDPIELDLYFERFLNKHRTSSPPDFDIDFSWQDRDEITDYIFKRYGQDNRVALQGSYSTFKSKSIVRELGKVFGLPKTEIDDLTRYRPNYQPKPNDRISQLIHTYGSVLQNFPNHLTIHASGILITENPITNYTALDYPPKNLPITHFDMYAAEDNGFNKYDILSQRGLGHIKDAIALVKQNKGEHVDIEDFTKLKNDEKVNEQIKSGETIGCFYIESPAMRQLLYKLRCSDYLTLVAASSIIRPGVAQSGMMKQFIQRYHNPGSFTYLHPKMEELLKETYGIMVYQEDVIKVAHHFAGLDLAEADLLRRAMAGKHRRRADFDKMAGKFRSNCREKGYSDELTEEVWRQIESFAGYSFSKAHSASFAVESYQSLYLKVYYPLEFMTAVINNFGGFYNSEFYLHEARRLGAQIEAPCLNNSTYLTNIKGSTIWLGFIHLNRFEQKTAQQIAPERDLNGPFQNLEDFMRRIPQPIEHLNTLIKIGAFRFTGKTKEALLWEAVTLLSKGELANHKRPKQPLKLFCADTKPFVLPELEHHPLDDAFHEIEILGFPLRSAADLFDLYQLPENHTEELVVTPAFQSKIGKAVCIAGYLVAVKDIKTSGGDHMQFGTLLDPEGNLFDTIHWPSSLKKYVFHGQAFYLIHGKVTQEFGYCSLEVTRMEKLPLKQRHQFTSTRVKNVLEKVG